MASGSPLVRAAKDSGYPVEFVRNFDGTEDHSTEVVSFPCKFPQGTTLANDMMAIDQLEVIKRLQKEWSDNAVSVTIYYRLHELEGIKQWLRENLHVVKSVSFLLHNEHGFDQAPLEEITEEKYLEMSSMVKPLVSIDGIGFDDVDIADCDTGACPVR
jgi:hypothetical protein